MTVVDRDLPRDVEAAIRWLLENWDAPPLRVHERGVWADYTSPRLGPAEDRRADFPEETDLAGLAGGSAIGSPRLARDFEAWLDEGAHQTAYARMTVKCEHPGQTPEERRRGAICHVCARTGTGDQVYETGERIEQRLVYRFPMVAALRRIKRKPVDEGLPNLASVAYQVANAGGDLSRVWDVYVDRYPKLADVELFVGHVAYALRALQREYRLEPPARRIRGPGERSEAQLDAEAART